MGYIKFNNDETHYNVKLVPFTSQHGYNAVRLIGDIVPNSNAGFKYYSDSDKEIADYSEYKYQYKPNEYAVDEDIIEYPVGSNQPLNPSAFDRINDRINQLNQEVVEVTPYTETKQAYIDDTEVEFDYHEGNITAYVADGQIPCEVVVEDNKIRVSFDKLEEPAKVTISIL